MPTNDLTSAFQSVAEQIAPGSRYIHHWPLTGGVSAQIDALEIELPSTEHQIMVMRRLQDHDWKSNTDSGLTKEYELHHALVAWGLPVPKPLLLDATSNHFPTPYFVMAMVAGTTTVRPAQLDHALDQMADFLIRLHELDVDHVHAAALPNREDPVAGALKYIPNNQEWSSLRAAIASWQMTPSKVAVLHGDYWPGNVLWHNGNLTAVIDWEDAAIGNPVSDLACARIELMSMWGEAAMERFSHRYLTATAMNIADLPLWEVYGGFAALATMAQWGLTPEQEAAHRQQTTRLVNRASKRLIRG